MSKEESKVQGLSLCQLLSLSHSLSVGLSLLCLSLSFHLLGCHALTPRGCIFLCFLNTTEL